MWLTVAKRSTERTTLLSIDRPHAWECGGAFANNAYGSTNVGYGRKCCTKLALTHVRDEGSEQAVLRALMFIRYQLVARSRYAVAVFA
jgi:hypothetical protein